MTIYGQRAGAPNGEFIDGVEFNEPQRRQQHDLGGSIGVQGIGYPHSMRKFKHPQLMELLLTDWSLPKEWMFQRTVESVAPWIPFNSGESLKNLNMQVWGLRFECCDCNFKICNPNNKHTVDGWNPANQLRLVVYPNIYRVLAPSQVVVWDFSHQQ